MKKIISMILAISMTLSSVQLTSFAENVNNKVLPNLCMGENLSKDYFIEIGQPKKFAKALPGFCEKMKEAIDLYKDTGVDMTSQVEADFVKEIFAKKESKLGKVTAWVTANPFISMIAYSLIYQFGFNYYNKMKTKYKAGKVETAIDPASTLRVLDTMMYTVKGQEKAKRQIKSIVLNAVDKNAQYAANQNKKSKKAGPGAVVLYMVGPSGVGKSFSAEIIRKILGGFAAEPFVIEASDIDKQSKTSASEQLFGMRTRQLERGGEVSEYAPFVQRIKAIPNSVIVINEYDKMHTPELDEKLRTIMDQGYLNVNGEKIDCSAATFIITSNESTGSVNKGNLENDNVDDGTGSRTFINHDKAFLNRIKLIEFDNLSENEYKEIAAIPFSQLVARYKEQYKVDIDLDGTICSLAQKVAELNKGARPIFTYLDSLNDRLLNEVVINNLNANEEVKYRVSFNKDTEEFKLENISKDHVDKNNIKE